MTRLKKLKEKTAAPRKNAEEKLKELSSGKIGLLQDSFWYDIQDFILNNKDLIDEYYAEGIYNYYFEQLQPTSNIMNSLTVHTKITSTQLSNEFSQIINRLKMMFNDLKYEIGEFIRQIVVEDSE